MPNLKSAKKRLRQDVKRRLRNRSARSTLRTAIKAFREAVAADDPDAKERAFRNAVKKIDQAAAKQIIHKNTAARIKSRLAATL